MATVDKIRNDIEKTEAKVVEQQKQLRKLGQETTEEENLGIIRMVKTVKLNNKELSVFLKACASGRISLPEGMQADLKGQEDSEDEE